MGLSPKLSTHFVVSRDITFDSCLELTPATPEKCTNKFLTMLVDFDDAGGTTAVDWALVTGWQGR